MKISFFSPSTYFRYISMLLLMWFLIFILISSILIVLLDSFELARRAASRPDVDGIAIVAMALLHLPYLIDITLPFVMLFAAMAAFWQMSRHNELTVSRAAGISIWQFLTPAIFIAFSLGVCKIFLLNPLAAFSVSLFQNYEVQYFDRRPNNPMLQGAGLWLRDYSGNNDLIIHSVSLDPRGQTLNDVTIFQFADMDRFSRRIKADYAVLANDQWRLSGVEIIGSTQTTTAPATLDFPTRLNWTRLEESFASPASMAIWRLPTFIDLLEDAGFSAAAYRVHFHVALASPLAMVSMVLLAAGFALRPPRRGGTLALLTSAAAAGLGSYLLTQVFFRLGLSNQLPPLLAAWAPIICVTMLGVAWLLYTEDG